MSFSPPTDIFLCKFQCELSTKKEKKICFAFCSQLKIETNRSEIKKNNFVYKVRILERKTELLYEIRVLLFFVALLLKYRKGEKKLLICLFWLLAQKHLQKYAGTAKLIFFIQVTDSARQFFFVFLFTL